LTEAAQQLVTVVTNASQVRFARRIGSSMFQVDTPERTSSKAPPKGRGGGPSERFVAIGASSGGTEAVAKIFASLPDDSPGIVFVQHMPAGYTTAFARRLDEISRLTVKEAQHGAPIVQGQALLAPGGRYLLVEKRRSGFVVVLDDHPRPGRHRPSVDVLFGSVAEVAGSKARGVLLTGMGTDGAEGLLAMRRKGCVTIAQNEETSVVFGMPKAAIDLGAASRVLPLGAIANAILAADPPEAGASG
jgi:two-component system chemotaxis response regulator CheB